VGQTNLETLSLHGHLLTDDVPFPLDGLLNLTTLDLGSRGAGDLGFNNVLNFPNLPLLEYLDISGNRFDSLPDLSIYPVLTQLLLENNLLEFEDIEAVLSQPGLSYVPQRIPEGDTTVVLLPGTSVTLQAETGGSANNYQWFKNGLLLSGATGSSLPVTTTDAVEGVTYFCEVSSPLVPDLTIARRLHYVIETPYNTNADPLVPQFTFTQLADTTIQFFIMSANLGDVNNDSLEDLGILLLDRMQVYHGGNLSQVPAMEVTALSGYQMKELRTADFNGDGQMDFAISSVNTSDPANTARLDFYFGSDTPDNVADHSIEVGDIQPVSSLGGLRSINFNVVGDVNTDGITDFLVNLNDDKTYLYYGGSTLSVTPDQEITGYDSDFGIDSLFLSASDLGNRVYPVGDINGDGADDFAVADIFRGFQTSNRSRGVVILHFGNSGGTITPDTGIALTDTSYANTNFFGYNVAVASVNDDAHNDLIVTAVSARDESVPGDNGSALFFVFYGGPLLDNVPDLVLKLPAAPFGLPTGLLCHLLQENY
ncbi:MAG: hypothetical protein AAFO69_10385, partial [Bacteroidota bacterium]